MPNFDDLNRMCARAGLADSTAMFFVCLYFFDCWGSKLLFWLQICLKVASRCDKSTCKARASYLIMVPSYDVLKVEGGGPEKKRSGELVRKHRVDRMSD